MLRFSKNIILAPHTSFKIGGKADFFCEVNNSNDLIEAIKWAREQQISYKVLGNGTNVLVGDKGFQGLVIKNHCQKIAIKNQTVVAESGVGLGQMIFEAVNQGLGGNGVEILANIPGTVGGAIYSNAGSYYLSRNCSVGDFLIEAKILTPQGEIKKVNKDYFQFGYRTSILKRTKDIVLEASFKFSLADDKEKILKAIKEDKKRRVEKYPSFPFAGSFFKNPNNDYAGRLIEKAGLKGFVFGGAKVSEKHANFLINYKHASASDIYTLSKIVRAKVKEKFGVELEEEVEIIGEF